MREFIGTGRPVPPVDPDSLPRLVKSSEPESSGRLGGARLVPSDFTPREPLHELAEEAERRE